MNDESTQQKSNFLVLFIFALAMGFLEAIVVVYVRELYYPEGFSFPLKMLPPWLIGIELIREFCMLLMLGSVAWISGKTFLQRLSIFLFCFGIWDIFYYIALKLFLGWPESLLTWDILFLIPITWIGPVLAPVICSAFMIIMSLMFEYFRIKNKINSIKRKELWLLIFGAVIIIISFTYDFGLIIIKGNYLNTFFTLPENSEFLKELTTFSPVEFKWKIFVIGMALIIIGNVMFLRRSINEKNIIC